MTREDIKRIIQAQGYRFQFQNRISMKGSGICRTLVYAWTRGGKKPKGRCLGRIEKVMAMEQDDFARQIEEKFRL